MIRFFTRFLIIFLTTVVVGTIAYFALQNVSLGNPRGMPPEGFNRESVANQSDQSSASESPNGQNFDPPRQGEFGERDEGSEAGARSLLGILAEIVQIGLVTIIVLTLQKWLPALFQKSKEIAS